MTDVRRIDGTVYEHGSLEVRVGGADGVAQFSFAAEPVPFTTSARTRFVFVGPFTQKDGRALYRDGSPVWRTDLDALLGGMGAEWCARAYRASDPYDFMKPVPAGLVKS